MKNCNEIYQENLKGLNAAFDFLNEKFFENALSKSVITIQADTKQRAYGWFTAFDAWRNTDENKSTEINISANYMDRPPHETISTLLHEMCHLHAYQNKIQDTSRSGTYHNARFKQIAENHGLTVAKVQSHGWTVTKLTDETKEKVEPILNLLTLKRILPSMEKGKKSSTRKYICPTCKTTVRATKSVNIICGDCQEQMIEIESALSKINTDNIQGQDTESLENYIHRFNDQDRFMSEHITFGEVVAELKKRNSELVKDEFFDNIA